jgi:hypothetical protein
MEETNKNKSKKYIPDHSSLLKEMKRHWVFRHSVDEDRFVTSKKDINIEHISDQFILEKFKNSKIYFHFAIRGKNLDSVFKTRLEKRGCKVTDYKEPYEAATKIEFVGLFCRNPVIDDPHNESHIVYHYEFLICDENQTPHNPISLENLEITYNTETCEIDFDLHLLDSIEIPESCKFYNYSPTSFSHHIETCPVTYYPDIYATIRAYDEQCCSCEFMLKELPSTPNFKYYFFRENWFREKDKAKFGELDQTKDQGSENEQNIDNLKSLQTQNKAHPYLLYFILISLSFLLGLCIR